MKGKSKTKPQKKDADPYALHKAMAKWIRAELRASAAQKIVDRERSKAHSLREAAQAIAGDLKPPFQLVVDGVNYQVESSIFTKHLNSGPPKFSTFRISGWRVVRAPKHI